MLAVAKVFKILIGGPLFICSINLTCSKFIQTVVGQTICLRKEIRMRKSNNQKKNQRWT